MKEYRLPSRRFIYSVTTVLGLSFTFILFLLAWFNSLDNAQKEFAFESISISSQVQRNVSAADDVTMNVATLLESLSFVSSDSFHSFTQSLLTRHAFIDSISFTEIRESTETLRTGATQIPIQCEYLTVRNKTSLCPFDVDDVFTIEMRNVISSAIETGDVVPSPMYQTRNGDSAYLLIKSVNHVFEQGVRPSNRAKHGIVVVSVIPAEIFGASMPESVSIRLQSEAEGIAGRQLLYRKRYSTPGNTESWLLTSLDDETLIQFPFYSTKLTIKRPIFWTDLDQRLILIALFLGAGVTLLLIALARAKEIQARELRERNKEIERQVERQTRELASARDQALEASRIKSEFLASMSHEIRTPLNAIIGMAELLAETPLSSDQSRYTNIFKRSGEALLSLVNDILDLSKIEAGQLVIENIDFNLPKLVEEATDVYSLKTDEKGIELICHVDVNVQQWVQGDPGRLRQIILNLLGNAIKFTEEGEIVLRVTMMPDQTDPNKLLFSVADTGIGIPHGKMQTIFGSFNQVDSSTTRKYGGTGLGLTISKRLAELMCGQMWVQSQPGEGSTFYFTAVIEPGEPSVEIPALPTTELHGKRVLVIDDNDTNRLIIQTSLSQRGVIVSEASTGREGLRLFSAAYDQGNPFDVVLSDCHMPEIDGFQVIQRIHEVGGNTRTVLMLSSSNLARDVERAKDGDIGGYLVKPIKTEDLLRAVIGRLYPSSGSDTNYLSTLEQKSFVGRAPILLVEDNEDNRLLVNAYLKKTSFDVEEAENGQVALEKFMEGEYSLVLMDVQMPVMDGHTATREIRRWERENGRDETPIIALTAHAVKEDMEKSLAAGCNTHLSKPIKKATLLQAIDRYLR